MKSKKINNKLTLNKKTIADLSSNEMKDAYAGGNDKFTQECMVTRELCPTYTCYTKVTGNIACPCYIL
jgi:hypothetical protein